MERIQTLIFDADGTLFDAREDIVAAVNHTLEVLGLPPRDPGYIISCVGRGSDYLLAECVGEQHRHLLDDALKIYTDYYIEHPAERATLYPHVKETLAHFAGKRKFVVTNRSEELAEASLRALSLRGHFERVIGARRGCEKPFPCMLEKIFSEMRAPRDSAMMIGDMAIDIEAGKISGIRTCFVTYGLGKRGEAEPLAPDYMIDDIAELMKIVE